MAPQDGEIDETALFDALVAQARAVDGSGDWERSRAEWAELYRRFPDRWEGAVGAAAALSALRRYEEAEALLSIAVPRFADAWQPACEFASLAYYQRDWPRCIARWAQVRARFPDRVEVARWYGIALRDSGRFQQADDFHIEAMAQFPEDFWLAYAYARTSQHQHRWDEALARWRLVRLRFPNEAAGYVGEAQSLVQLGRPDEAREALRRGDAAAPGHADLEREWRALEPDAAAPAVSAAPMPADAAPPPGQPIAGVLISRDPVIIHSATYSFADVVVPTMEHYRQTGRRVHYFFNSNMSIEFELALRDRLTREAVRLRDRYPDMSMTFLVNDVGELAVARRLGLPAELVSNNAFVDERLFVIDPQRPKRFDAVYNARFHPYKRHELATAIDSLVLLAAQPTAEHLAGLAALLPRATLTGEHVDSAAVVATVNSARCGLALSRSEGANYATIEYLLCGVPVVTTRCIGGRAWWLSDEVAVTVEDRPRDVAAGVARMIMRGVSPEAVREHTLQRLHRERLAFFALVDRIFTAHGQPARRYEAEFARDFSDKWNYQWRQVSELCAPA